MCAVSIIQDEGATVSSTASTLNFVGRGVKATASGAVATVAVQDSYFDIKRDFGAIGDGMSDDTAALQAAVTAAGAQQTPLVISPGAYKALTRIEIPSNTVIFGYGARLLSCSSTAGVGGVPLVITGHTSTPVRNIKIYGLEINGRKSSQPSSQACFLIQGNVQDVLVKDCYFHDATGDGWYTLESSASAFYVPTNILFEDIVSTANTRQGASICVGRFVTVRGGVYSGTSGAAPGAGIDIEPSVPTAPCEYIVVDGVRFANNAGAGLLIEYGVSGASPVRYITVENCHMVENGGSGVTIRGAQDVRLANCLVASNTGSGIELNGFTSSPLRDIVVENSRITNNGHVGVFGVISAGYSAKCLKFTDLSIVNNGASVPNNYAGMQFQGPLDDLQIIGCTSQNRSVARQSYGLQTGPGVTRLRADLNNFSGNSTGPKALGDDLATRLYGNLNHE